MIFQGFFQFLPFASIIFGLITHLEIFFIISGFSLIVYPIIVPFWIGLNLLLTKKDGHGRVMENKGKKLCIILGIIFLALPVLFIVILPLAIGGLAGYTVAMNRHRSNMILDYTAHCAITTLKENSRKESCYEVLNEDAPADLSGSEFKIQRGSSELIITTPRIQNDNIRESLIERSSSIVLISESNKKVKFRFRY